jgi:hypothetical protein
MFDLTVLNAISLNRIAVTLTLRKVKPACQQIGYPA